MESSEDDFDPLMRLYRPKPSQVAYEKAVGIQELMGVRPRSDMD